MRRVEDIMHKDPDCCLPTETLQEVARRMVACDCGAIPVVENRKSMRLLGLVTDRDIVCRAVAVGTPPSAKMGHLYSSPALAVKPETSMEECLDLMSIHLVRRLPVVDEEGRCVGLVTQAQVARYASPEETGRVVRAVSEKTETSSAFR